MTQSSPESICYEILISSLSSADQHTHTKRFMSGYGSGAADSDALALEHVRFSTAPHTRCAPLPLVGRAIACGQFSANGRNIGIEIGSCAQLWNPAALSHARFESKISTCDCPPPQGGREHTEIAARTNFIHGNILYGSVAKRRRPIGLSVLASKVRIS